MRGFSICKIKNILRFTLCALCLMLCYLLIASAQDVKDNIRKTKKNVAASIETINSDAAELSEETGGNGSLDLKESDKERKTEKSDRNAREKRFQQDGQSGPRQGGMIPPEVRKTMQEENISPQDMRDPEVRKKLQEKMQAMQGKGKGETEPSQPNDFQPGSDSQTQPQRKSPEGGKPADEGLKRYMDVVVNKNLFLPLGSGGEEKKSTYALTGVISNTSNESDNKAIIEEIGSGKGYYVSEGDTFADKVEVVDVGEQMVKLDRSGEAMMLRLGEGTSSGRRGGGGPGGGRATGGGEEFRSGQGQKPGSEVRGGQGDFDPSQIPPFAMVILKQRGISIEDLKNNPDLREKLRAEFTQRFMRSGESGGPQFRLEGRGESGGQQPRLEIRGRGPGR